VRVADELEGVGQYKIVGVAEWSMMQGSRFSVVSDAGLGCILGSYCVWLSERAGKVS